MAYKQNKKPYYSDDEEAAIAALTEEHYLLGGTCEELMEKGVLEEIIETAKDSTSKRQKEKKRLDGVLSLIKFY